MSTVRNASDALSPSSGPIEFADGLRKAIDTLVKKHWGQLRQSSEDKLKRIAAVGALIAENMSTEAAKRSIAALSGSDRCATIQAPTSTPLPPGHPVNPTGPTSEEGGGQVNGWRRMSVFRPTQIAIGK